MSLPNRPCGTPEEIEAIGLNPAALPSCAMPNGSKFAGCTMADRCKCRHKDGTRIKFKTPVYDAAGKLVKPGGPAYFGVRIAKPVAGRGVGKSQELMLCHQFVQLSDQIKANGGSCEIIAWEGDEFELRGSKKMPPDATKGEDPAGPWTWKTITYKLTVPKCPRPAERPALLDISFFQQAREREEDAEYEQTTRIIGRAEALKEQHAGSTERK